MGFLEIATFLLSGLLLGLKHSLDIDHLAAISTIVSENPKRKISILKGAIWGVGHTTTLFIVGFLVLAFKLTIPNSLANIFELVVGFILVYLGLSLAFKIRKEKVHVHIHDHDGQKHFHVHSHKESTKHNHLHKPFWVGIAHGLAGSAALMLIVLSSVKSAILGLFFILIFGIGLIAGMTIFSLIISFPINLANQRVSSLSKSLKLLIAATSTAIGLSIIFHTI